MMTLTLLYDHGYPVNYKIPIMLVHTFEYLFFLLLIYLFLCVWGASVCTGRCVFTDAPAHACLCQGRRRMSDDLFYHCVLCSLERGCY